MTWKKPAIAQNVLQALRTQDTYSLLALLGFLALFLSSLQHHLDTQQLQLRISFWSSTVAIATAAFVLVFYKTLGSTLAKFTTWKLPLGLSKHTSPTQKICLAICAPILAEVSRISLLRIVACLLDEGPVSQSFLTAFIVGAITFARYSRPSMPHWNPLLGSLFQAVYTLIICSQFIWLDSLWSAFLTSALLISAVAYSETIVSRNIIESVLKRLPMKFFRGKFTTNSD